jgi:hypothetical protein
MSPLVRRGDIIRIGYDIDLISFCGRSTWIISLCILTIACTVLPSDYSMSASSSYTVPVSYLFVVASSGADLQDLWCLVFLYENNWKIYITPEVDISWNFTLDNMIVIEQLYELN